MVDPPSSDGAEKETLAVPLIPETDAVPIEGTPGAEGPLEGVTAFDALLAEPAPAALVAVTVNVYSVPFDKPVTVIGLADPEAEMLPGEEVTVYEVIAEPPLNAGAVKVTTAFALPATAVPIVGALGIV